MPYILCDASGVNPKADPAVVGCRGRIIFDPGGAGIAGPRKGGMALVLYLAVPPLGYMKRDDDCAAPANKAAPADKEGTSNPSI